MRIGQDPDSFDEYKNIIKELLFNGANKSLRTKSGHTPYDLFLGLENELEPEEFASLSRTLSSKTSCLCFTRHRPIKKSEKSVSVLAVGFLFNALIIGLYYWIIHR